LANGPLTIEDISRALYRNALVIGRYKASMLIGYPLIIGQDAMTTVGVRLMV
jgi:hypothetical protein